MQRAAVHRVAADNRRPSPAICRGGVCQGDSCWRVPTFPIAVVASAVRLRRWRRRALTCGYQSFPAHGLAGAGVFMITCLLIFVVEGLLMPARPSSTLEVRHVEACSDRGGAPHLHSPGARPCFELRDGDGSQSARHVPTADRRVGSGGRRASTRAHWRCSASTTTSIVRESRATEPPVDLYIGYYGQQHQSSTIHSPLNCLPGSGWQVTSHDTVGVGSSHVLVNRRCMCATRSRS